MQRHDSFARFVASPSGVRPQALPFSAGEWRLLEYFAENTANVLCLFKDGRNPFLYLLLPLAWSSTAVLRAIITAAGAHMKRRSLLSDRSLAMAMWRNYAMAAADLRSRLVGHAECGWHDALQSLVVSLLLYFAEVSTVACQLQPQHPR